MQRNLLFIDVVENVLTILKNEINRSNAFASKSGSNHLFSTVPAIMCL